MSVQSITKRKKDHLKFALSETSQTGETGLNKYRFVHNSLPEMNFENIDTSTVFLGKKVRQPFFISCMTGGLKEGKKINRNLASAAQKYGIAMGVGSQRAAIEHPELEELFTAREVAPDIPLLANIGLVQLNYGFGLKEYQRCIDMIKADALVVHINPIQEVIQPEGDRNWEGLINKLGALIGKLSVPVIVKEVGFGLSGEVMEKLYNIGVRLFDTAGWGGTSWAIVEGLRGKADRHLGELFGVWGIPTSMSIKMAKTLKDKKKDITILGSGGIRNGIEMAKAIALGADMVGVGAPFAKAALESKEETEKLIERYSMEIKTAMFGVGAKSINELKRTKIIEG